MRILRYTMYSPDLQPVSPIVRDIDMTVLLEEAAYLQPGMFAIIDIFEMPDNSTLEQCIAGGLERMHERIDDERNMAMHYYWHAQQLMFAISTGVIANTRPAPLTADQLKVSLEQLATHPDYRRQTIRSIADDGTFVVLADGRVDLGYRHAL